MGIKAVSVASRIVGRIEWVSVCNCNNVLCYVPSSQLWPRSCPQCPVLTRPAWLLWTHACGFFDAASPSLTWSFSFPALFSECAHSRTASILSFLHPVVFQASFTVGHTYLSFWWSKLCIELSSNTIFLMKPFFCYQLSLSSFTLAIIIVIISY